MEPPAQPRDASCPQLGVALQVALDNVSAREQWFDRHHSVFPWCYLLAIGGAETLTSAVSVHAGLALHCFILMLLPIHAVIARGRPYQPLLQCLVLAPLIRIMSLTLPLIGFPLLDWYLLVSIPIFVASWMVANLLGYSRRDVGLVWRGGGMQLAILLCGPLLGWIEWHILPVQGLAAAATLPSLLPPTLILFFCTGLMEEIVFRGVMQRAAFGIFADDGILYLALLFALLHTGYRSLEDSVFVFLVGVLFAIIARRSGSILGITGCHGLANVNLYVVLPLLFPNT
jgi:hypothetical protein